MNSIPDTNKDTLHSSGALDEEFLTAFCPPGVILNTDGEISTRANLRNDPAGAPGIIRHGHTFGCLLLELKLTNGELPWMLKNFPTATS